ncbi:hypothetical protein N7G274_009964 [Stereocaulon virgatum]|uniref:Uncharacterized protein n=1 Tax=Stereocaulon virgatum TaxID=373712 RepID=A0ABR3ZWZ3_9LECA
MSNNIKPHVAALFRLPLEMRHSIYNYLLEFTVLPPASPYEVRGDRREEGQYWGSMFYEQDFHTASTIGPLLKCRNKQLQQEVQSFLRRKIWKEGASIKYKLDLMVWECSLTPTCLSLPTPSAYVDTLEVDLRFFSYSTPAWCRPHPGMLAQYLLQMLRRSFERGPHFTPPLTEEHMPLHPWQVRLDLLAVNFIQSDTSISIDPRNPLTLHDDLSPPEAVRRLRNPAQFALLFLREYLDMLANSGLLSGKVKRLRFCCGTMQRDWKIVKRRRIAAIVQKWGPYGWDQHLRETQRLVNNDSLRYVKLLDCLPKQSKNDANNEKGKYDNGKTKYLSRRGRC